MFVLKQLHNAVMYILMEFRRLDASTAQTGGNWRQPEASVCHNFSFSDLCGD